MQSLAVDVKNPKGLDICRKLATRADILVENFRSGTMRRLVLEYESLAKLNPSLIYVSISGYGQTGPRSTEPSMDLVMQASAGLMSITGTPGGETVRTGHSWTSFARAIGRPDIAADERYRTNPLRVKHRSVLEPILEEMFLQQPAAHWIKVLAREGIPCSMVRNLKEVVEDEHLQARNMLPVLEHATAGPIRVTGAPVKLSQNPGEIGAAARPLGADSAAVLSEFLGLSEEEIRRLRVAGAISGGL